MYDVAVIGGGPGGYVAAIKAAQLGLKTVCIEKRGALGGTCLNVGCIPSKTLLHISHLYEQARHDFAGMGIPAVSGQVDVAAMLARKDSVVAGLASGIEMLLGKNKVDYVKGHAAFAGKNALSVRQSDGTERKIEARNIVVATGSSVSTLPHVAIDGAHVVTSDQAISLPKVPKRLAVLGGGVIGLELGSVWRRLGSEVTVIEYLDRILPGMDGEVAAQAKRMFEKQGIAFRLSEKLASAEVKNGVVRIVTEAKDGAKTEIETDVLLVAVGRKANTEGLALEKAGVATDERGRVATDGHLRTNVPHIYAIGDVTTGPMLAHKAEEEGVAAAEIIAGQAGHVDYNLVPGVVYTHPEIASIGKTEEQLKETGIAYNKGKFPFAANSRARTTGETDGFVKVLADKATDEVLGVHIIGPHAGTLIGEASVAMAYRASSEDIARICHSHPDLNEAIKEAALAAHFKAIHA
jgi:dihydrolipoamide dehydrogenase